MADELNQSSNDLIAAVLERAGVPSQNIELPPASEAELKGGTPSLDGLPKGQVKGDILEDTEEAVPSESKLPEPSEAESGESKVQLLDKAGIEALITGASSKFQGIMDRKINQINYQMQQQSIALNQFFQSQEDSSISGLPADEQVARRLERLEKGGQQSKINIQVDQPIEQQPVPYAQLCANVLDAIGINIDDKRIDWAKEPGITAEAGFNRFLVSVKKSLAEDQTKAIQELKDNGNKEITKLRKKTGVDKVSIAGPSGAGLPDIDKMTSLEKINYGFQQAEELSQVSQ